MTDENKTAGNEGNGATSLSEVIRLQAVALARMSERMANQQGAERFPLPAARSSRQGENLPALSGDPALSDESLPVLNTFRKFLEAERRRARRRVIWVSIAFGAGFLVVAGVLAWAGRERIAALKNEIVAGTVQADTARQKADADIREVADSAAATAALLKLDLRRNVLSSHSILSSNLNTKLSGSEAELEQLKEKLSSLEMENAMLTGQLKELADTTRQLQENYAAWIQSGPTEEPGEPAARGSLTGAAPEAKTLPLLIHSRERGRDVRLRVPMAP